VPPTTAIRSRRHHEKKSTATPGKHLGAKKLRMSKKAEMLVDSIVITFFYRKFIRRHQTLRMPPARLPLTFGRSATW